MMQSRLMNDWALLHLHLKDGLDRKMVLILVLILVPLTFEHSDCFDDIRDQMWSKRLSLITYYQ